MSRLLLPLLVCAALGLHTGSCSNILLVTPLGSRSHLNFYGGIVETLADRGHQITVISSYGIRQHPNVTQILIDFKFDEIVTNTFSLTDWRVLMKLTRTFSVLCAESLGHKDVQKLNINDFDLMMNGILTSPCYLSLIDKTEIPLILFTPNTMTGGIHEMVGNIDFPSFVPFLGSGFVYPMSFFMRTANVLLSAFVALTTEFYISAWLEEDCKALGHCPEDMTKLLQLERRASLLFINNVRSLDSPMRPYMPSVIPIGGLNCRPAKPLPEDLATWVRDAGEAGFVYLSLGSAVKPSDMSEEHRQILVRVFGSLPQRVLWKWDEDSMDDLPSNVKLAKWLPQQDILGDANIKLFISHGGLFSTLEATFHAVPVLGMPVFGDQPSNMAIVTSEGWGDVMDWAALTEDLFRHKITELITNKKYSEVAKSRSVIMRDVPMSPHATTAYWTEYVIRHKGAPHLRSPVLDMEWYKVYNLDVWAFLITTVGVILLILALLTLALARCCYRRVKAKFSPQSKKKQH